MATTQTIVLTVKCGTTLKTVINGQPVEIECEGVGGTTWEPPPPPSGGGGVVAYLRSPSDGPRLDLSALTARYHSGQLDLEDLPPIGPGGEWAVYWEGEGDFKSLGPMTSGD